MARKVGEIFEHDGEWYQCVVAIDGCRKCSFRAQGYSECFPGVRSDGISVIFKKLEKVGEPITVKGRTFQKLILDNYSCTNCVFNAQNKECYKNSYIDGLCSDNGIWVEIKQNKEDMEEKKLNLKPFDIQKAREGKPVCTRDGRKARIICFDRKFYHDDGYNYPIVAMVNDNDNELVHAYTQDGLLIGNKESELDLMMLPEKKEGWVNVYTNIDVENSRYCSTIYASKEEALNNISKVLGHYISTGKTEWEE